MLVIKAFVIHLNSSLILGMGNTFCLQRTNNLISILQQERNLIITKYMRTSRFTIHVDISGKNADYIKKRSPILSHRIFTAVQNIFIIHLYKTKCFNITSSSTHRICRLWLYQINVCLIVGRKRRRGTTYAVAVSATTDGGTTVSTNNQTYIYLVKPQPTYPVRGTARDIKTLCFVEVNNENILNCGEYTMAKDGTPFFDVVSIFAANINVDSKTGRAHIFCNDQVSFLLKNADQIIRPLQAKGIHPSQYE